MNKPANSWGAVHTVYSYKTNELSNIAKVYFAYLKVTYLFTCEDINEDKNKFEKYKYNKIGIV